LRAADGPSELIKERQSSPPLLFAIAGTCSDKKLAEFPRSFFLLYTKLHAELSDIVLTVGS
jgi:hypothetical protein